MLSRILKARTAKAAVAAAVLLLYILITVFPLVVSAGEPPSFALNASEQAETGSETSRKSNIGKSPLVDAENSRMAEEAKNAQEDTRSGIVKYFSGKWNSFKKAIDLNFISNNGWLRLLEGLGVTLKVTAGATVIGIILGLLFGMIRSVNETTGGLKLLSALSKLYINVIRGTPAMVQLLLIYFVVFASTDINKVFVAILAFGINSGAYVAEIVRSGIMSIDSGQMEAARSLGLPYHSSMIRIVIPQAFKNIMPALGNEFIVLLKETSIAGYIALEDLTQVGNLIRSRTADAFYPLIAVALIYLVLVLALTKLLGILERRLRKSDRR